MARNTKANASTADDRPRTFDVPAPEAGADTPAFRVVDDFYHTKYRQEKVVISTPAPWDTPDEMTDANEVVKSLSWDEHHYSFNNNRGAWTMDPSGLEALREKAVDAGYEWAEQRDAESEPVRAVADAVDYVEPGGSVTVEYEQKNGNGFNSYTGEVTAVDEESRRFIFNPADSRRRRVMTEEGEAKLFSVSGSHAPYMGRVSEITVTPADHDESDDGEADEADDTVRREIESKVEAAADVAALDSVDIGFAEALEMGGLDSEVVREKVEAGEIQVDIPPQSGS